MDRWSGKIAVITGSNSGIGFKTALALADKDIIAVLLTEQLENVQELSTKTKGVIHGVKCNVANEADILNAFRFIDSSLGGVDILINNVPASNICSLTSGPTQDIMKSVLDVNVLGLCLCTREAIKSMRKRGDNGHIIHINSGVAHGSSDNNTNMSATNTASMHAITALTECLRQELLSSQSNIKVTNVCPAATKTDISNGEQPSDNQQRQTVYRTLQDDDVVQAILYTLGTRPGVQVHEIKIQPLGKINVKH